MTANIIKNNVDITNVQLSEKFKNANIRFQAAWTQWLDDAHSWAIYMNEMIEILHFEHPDWSIRTICRVIRRENDGLRNFGESTMYKHLSNNNKALLDLTKSQNRQGKTKTKLQNNVTEPFVLSREQKVIGGSSSRASPLLEAFRQEKGKLVEPSDDDVIDVSTFAIPREGREREEQEVIYDNPKKIKQYEVQLKELNRRYEELEAKYEQVITPFEVKQITIVKDQELPFIIKVDPYKRSVTSLELDQKEIKKLMGF